MLVGFVGCLLQQVRRVYLLEIVNMFKLYVLHNNLELGIVRIVIFLYFVKVNRLFKAAQRLYSDASLISVINNC